jgi:hypothetical protein
MNGPNPPRTRRRPLPQLKASRVLNGIQLPLLHPCIVGHALPCALPSNRTRARTRTRTKTNPNDTKANAAGRRGVRVRSANGMCKNQGAWAAKCLTKREALVGGIHSGNAHRKAPDLRNTKFHIAEVENGFSAHRAPSALPPGKCPSMARNPSSAFRVTVKRGGPQNRNHASGPLVA